MKTIKEIIKNDTIDIKRLKEYGFKLSNNIYYYNKDIYQNKFKVIIEVDNNSVITKIIDNDTSEEYYNIYNENYNGTFINELRNEYENLLLDFKQKCFINKHFNSNEAEAITNYIKNTYKNDPEFLWEKDDSTGVFRRSDNKKWYAIIMNTNGDIFDYPGEKVNVINVKLPPEIIIDLLQKKGYYKAYHMNKKYWLSIVLDKEVGLSEIQNLIDISYELVK